MKPDFNCKKCGSDGWIVRQRKMTIGAVYFPYCCKACGYISAFGERKDVVLNISKKLGRMPEWI
jgi:hypothetical protein